MMSEKKWSGRSRFDELSRCCLLLSMSKNGAEMLALLMDAEIWEGAKCEMKRHATSHNYFVRSSMARVLPLMRLRELP